MYNTGEKGARAIQGLIAFSAIIWADPARENTYPFFFSIETIKTVLLNELNTQKAVIINFVLLSKNLNLPPKRVQVISFVQHMKVICAPTTPPWMEVALAEAKKAKFIKETLSPTSEMANKYHTYVGLSKATGSTAWCSSFISWCLNEVGQQNAKSAGSQSVLWNEGKLFKRIEEPVYGCIVLMTNYVKNTGKSNSHGHVTFLYGVDSDEGLICLGRNQKDRLKFSRYKTKGIGSIFRQYQKSEGGKVFVQQEFNGFFLPIGYSETNCRPPKVVDIKKLNDDLAGKEVKTDGKSEKTT